MQADWGRCFFRAPANWACLSIKLTLRATPVPGFLLKFPVDRFSFDDFLPPRAEPADIERSLGLLFTTVVVLLTFFLGLLLYFGVSIACGIEEVEDEEAVDMLRELNDSPALSSWSTEGARRRRGVVLVVAAGAAECGLLALVCVLYDDLYIRCTDMVNEWSCWSAGINDTPDRYLMRCMARSGSSASCWARHGSTLCKKLYKYSQPPPTRTTILLPWIRNKRIVFVVPNV